MTLSLPIVFLQFWYLEAPKSLFSYLLSMNNSFLHMLSIPLFLRTFFKPLKNEYRGDLIGFSIGMGIVMKLTLISAGMIIFLLLLILEVLFYLFFLALPVLTVLAVFTKL